MIHKMKLWNDSFEAIKNGTKIVEMRLNDEKRKHLKIDDIIVFTNTKTSEELSATIVELEVYKDFFELYKHYNKIVIGYKENEVADPDDMYDYYSKEQIEKFGALAIKIRI